MKTFKISSVVVLFTAVIVLGRYFLMDTPSKKKWIISGGEPNSKYNEVALSLKKIIEKKNDLVIEIQSSSGSKENLTRVSNGIADLCLVQNDIEGDEKIRSIATLYEEVLHVIVKEDTTSISELSGCSISIGPKGGGTENLALATLEQLGIKRKDISCRKESLQSGLLALKNGKTKAVCAVTGIGNLSIKQFLEEGGHKLLFLGKDISENTKYVYPYIHPAVIPSGAYPISPGKGLPENKIPTIGTRVVLACQNNLSNDDIFWLTHFIAENKASLVRSHPLLAQMGSPQDLNQIQFPIHEGAELHYDRNEPSFFQEWSETIGLILSILAITWGATTTIRQIILMRLKDSLDKYFEKVDAITSELIDSVDEKRAKEIAKELHDIRRETTKKLIAEELATDDSFVIFQRQLHTAQQLVNETLRKRKI